MAPNKEEITTESEAKINTQQNSVHRKNSSPDPVPPHKRDVYPYFVSTSVPELHDSLYRAVFREILDNGILFNEPEAKKSSPFEYKSREEVKSLMNFNLDEDKVNHDELLDIVRKVIKFSPHPSHPYKIDLHGAGLDAYGIIGDWLGTALSALVITYSLAPVFTLMEYEVERRVRDLLKYPSDSGDGLIIPGAAEGNGYAIQIALQAKFPEVKKRGILGAGIPQPVLFVSEHGCPSVLGYSAWEGLGTTACIKVLTDEKGKMDVKDLEKKICLAKNEGKEPFLIIATAGTYFLGAIDPLDEIAEVAKRHGLWLHVDAQLAGSIIFSEKEACRLKGVERSDSFLWSADKGLCAPVTMAILVTKASDIFKRTFSYGAQYVFLPNSLYNNGFWDKGDNTMQCTRRPDVVKLWLMWKAKGKLKLGRHVDYCYEMTVELVQELERRNDAFQLILPEFQSHQVSFYYIPRVLRPYSISFREEILKKSKFTREMRKILGLKGIMLTCIASLPRFHDSTPFFVFTLVNSALTRPDLIYLLDQIEYQGEDSSLQELLRSHILGSSRK